MIQQRLEHPPGHPAPSAGEYEQINIFGQPTGIRVMLDHGHNFPAAPVGHFWRTADEDAAEV